MQCGLLGKFEDSEVCLANIDMLYCPTYFNLTNICLALKLIVKIAPLYVYQPSLSFSDMFND